MMHGYPPNFKSFETQGTPTNFGSSGQREMEYRYFFVGDIGFKRKAQALYLVERQSSPPMPGRLTEFSNSITFVHYSIY
jgi:hypothetical protein